MAAPKRKLVRAPSASVSPASRCASRTVAGGSKPEWAQRMRASAVVWSRRAARTASATWSGVLDHGAAGLLLLGELLSLLAGALGQVSVAWWIARSGGAAGSPHVYAANLLVAVPLYLAMLRVAEASWARAWLALGALVAYLSPMLNAPSSTSET